LALLSKISKKNKRKNRFSYGVKSNRERNKRGMIKRLIFLTILSAITFSIFSIINQKITEVQYLNEINRVSLDDLSAISSKIYNKGFLQIGLSQLKEEIETFNWVKSASLERRWPNQINIYIEEEQIIGRWNSESIMNSKGTLFILNQQTLPNGLVEFYGPDGQEEIVFEKYLSFKEELAIRGILIEQVMLDFKGSWSITIRPDITIRFGKENITERFDRFLMIWDESLLDNLTVIEYIDLRYTEGFSVKKRN
tara:strand:- start:546 stop:1304 length:759 start_codon:yes stop_codon:yes gene_type:complete